MKGAHSLGRGQSSLGDLLKAQVTKERHLFMEEGDSLVS